MSWLRQSRISRVVETESNLKIRIQPRDIEVTQKDPFKNDLLDRKESIDVLTNIVRSIDGPGTLAVDAPWGAGKTTFIRIWRQVLCEAGFPVVSFNAWETDFSNDPFVALSEEIIRGLGEYSEDSLSGKIERLRDKASEVAIRAVPALVRVATAGVLDIDPLLEKEASTVLASYAKDRLAAHVEAQKSLQSFKTTLQDTASTLAQNNDGLPLVIIIDELDRCRPLYAVELLEVAKHIFSVDHIVFVLAVNRPELAHSVRALYGNSFDAPDYLMRFFDLDFRLPNPERRLFIASALTSTGIEDYFSRTRDRSARDDYGTMLEILIHFLGTPSLSIRTIGQAIRRLGLVLASLRSDQRMFGLATVVATVIRTLDPDLYGRFLRGEASDREVVDRVFHLTENEYLRESSLVGNPGPAFEALVIHGCREVSKLKYNTIVRMDSPLLEEYSKYVSEREENTGTDSRHTYAVEVLEYSASSGSSRFTYQTFFGYEAVIKRIELVSEELFGSDV